MPLLFRKRVLGTLGALNVGLLCFAFPITSTVPLFLNMPSYFFNLGLRAVYLLLSLYLIFGACLHRSAWKFPPGAWALLIFWLIYGVRLVYDVQVKGIVFKGDLLKLYGFAFGNCLAGALATLLTLRWATARTLQTIVISFITIGCLGILAGVVFQHQTLNPAEIVNRARFTIDNGTERGRDVLNPITISLTGQLMASAMFYLYMNGRLTMRRALWAIPGVLIGLLVLVMGGSRGPFLGTLVCFLLIIGIRIYHTRKTSLNLLRMFVVFSAGLVYVVNFVVNKLAETNLVVLQRLSELGQGTEKEVRTYQWEAAVNQFLENPILGDQYLERAFGYYPHNVYLEVLMATGVVGGFFFFGMLIVAGWMMYKDMRTNSPRILFGVLLFAVLLAHMTSGSLFASVGLWGGLAVYFGMRRNIIKLPLANTSFK